MRWPGGFEVRVSLSRAARLQRSRRLLRMRAAISTVASAGCGAGDAVLVEASEFVEGPLPTVALVFDEALKHSYRGGLGVLADEPNVPEEGSDAGEVGDFCEETAYFGIGVFAGLEAAEELHD